MTATIKSYVTAAVARGAAQTQNSKTRAIVISLTSILLLVVTVFVPVEASLTSNATNDQSYGWKTPSELVKSACSETRYPNRCVSTMASYQTARLHDLTKIAVKVSMERAQNAHDFAASLSNNIMNERERAAWQDCVELFEDTMDRLNVSLTAEGSINNDDVPFWLSAALTNLDTCLNGFSDFNLTATNSIRALMYSRAANLSELVSNSLSMYKLVSSLPSNSRKNRRLLSPDEISYSKYNGVNKNGFPEWISAGDRELLQSTSSPAIRANVVVAKDGSGNYRTIAQAVKSAPQKSRRRYVIYIKAGIYKENIDISKKITNLMFVGDGKDITVVTGSKSVQDGVTTFKTATVAVSANGFIARDMTFENNAGPQKHQAVALRVGSDKSVVYRCRIKGYQDTLYVFSLRQFYREVDIYGTVDFIFGNAAVVIQNSNIIARRPMSNQKNTITAQGRTDPNENTGISIHNCRVIASSDLLPVKRSTQTYLGRPWKQYSRTVFMQSTLDDLITPTGWLAWEGKFALRTLYYGEYMNRGRGAGTLRRVKWGGFRVIKRASEASGFTVGQFISGNSWIPYTGVAFTSGLK